MNIFCKYWQNTMKKWKFVIYIIYIISFKRSLNIVIKYKWYNGKVPKDIEIKQVYGIVFNEDGSISK